MKQNWSFEKINKTDKRFVKLTKKEKPQINKTRVFLGGHYNRYQ